MRSSHLILANVAVRLFGEVHTNKIPLSHIEYPEFIELVVNQNIRPERPDGDEAPQLTDDSWQLAELCWKKDPLSRPNIGTVRDMMSRLLDSNPNQRVMKVSALIPGKSSSALCPHALFLCQSQGTATPPVILRHPEVPVPDLHVSLSPSESHPGPYAFREECRLEGHKHPVYAVAFSPDGKQIVSGSWDRTILVWDWGTQKVILGPLLGHTSYVGCLAYSPDDQRIASGSADKSVMVWDARSGETLHRLTKHTQVVTSVAFSPDGRMIASGSRDRTIQIWDADTGEIIHSMTFDKVYSVVFSPNGRYLAIGMENGVEVWDVQSWQRVCGRPSTNGPCRAVAVLPDSNRIACADGSRVCIMDLKTGELIMGPTQQRTASIRCLTISPDGTWIASGSLDTTIRIWDTATGNQISNFETESWVWSAAISPSAASGMQIATACNDNTINLYSCDSVL